MAEMWQTIVSLDDGESEGQEAWAARPRQVGSGRREAAATSDDEGEPVHAAVCLLEEEEEDEASPPSRPGNVDELSWRGHRVWTCGACMRPASSEI